MKHVPKGSRRVLEADCEVRLEQAAEVIGQPVSRGEDGREVVEKHLGNGNRVEVRRLYLFDDRGLTMALFERDGSRPFISGRAFRADRFLSLLDWFTYLGNRPDALRSEERLNRATEEYHEARRRLPI